MHRADQRHATEDESHAGGAFVRQHLRHVPDARSFQQGMAVPSPIGSKRCDAFRETEIRLAATAGLKSRTSERGVRHGLAAGDRVNLNRPVGDASRPLLP